MLRTTLLLLLVAMPIDAKQGKNNSKVDDDETGKNTGNEDNIEYSSTTLMTSSASTASFTGIILRSPAVATSHVNSKKPPPSLPLTTLQFDVTTDGYVAAVTDPTVATDTIATTDVTANAASESPSGRSTSADDASSASGSASNPNGGGGTTQTSVSSSLGASGDTNAAVNQSVATTAYQYSTPMPSSSTVTLSFQNTSDAASDTTSSNDNNISSSVIQNVATTAYQDLSSMPSSPTVALSFQNTSDAASDTTSSNDNNISSSTVKVNRVEMTEVQTWAPTSATFMTTDSLAKGTVADQSNIRSTTAPSGVKYSNRFRIVNKQFVTALSNKTGHEYNLLANTVNLSLFAAYSRSFGKLFTSIDDITFSEGSIVVDSQFTLSSQASDANLNETAVALVSSFAYLNYTLDSITILPSFPLSLLPVPPGYRGIDSMLLIGLVAGLVIIVIVLVIVLSILVCRSKRSIHSETSSQASMVSGRSGSVSASEYDPTSPAGLPSARKTNLFWKGNRTAMNDPGEFDDNYTFWRSTDDHALQPQQVRAVRGKSTALPDHRRRHTRRVPAEQTSETESSDWRYIAQEPGTDARPLTGRLERAVNNAAGRNVRRPGVVNPTAVASSRSGYRLRRVDPQSVAIVNDVDERSVSSADFYPTPYPVRQAVRPMPSPVRPPPGMHRNMPIRNKAGVHQIQQQPPTPPMRGSQVEHRRGIVVARPSPGPNRSFYQDNAGGAYGQGLRPTGWGLPTRPTGNHRSQLHTYQQ